MDGKGRLFGSAIARAHQQPAGGGVVNGTSFTVRPLRPSIFARMDTGNRRGAASVDDGGRAGPIRKARVKVTAEPYDWQPVQASKSKWDHDMYEGGDVGPSRSEIFVRNLPKGTSTKQITTLFSSAGQISRVKVERGPITTAVVGFIKFDAAASAASRFHGSRFGGNVIKVAVVEEPPRNKESDFASVAPIRRRRVAGAVGRSFTASAAPRVSIFSRMD